MNEYAGRLAGQLVTVGEYDAHAFEVLVAESASLAVRVAYSVLRNRHDAEDVAQEAFIRAHRSFSRLRDRERFRAWLVRMTWRLAIDSQRGRKRRGVREDAIARVSGHANDVETDAIGHERAERLWDAMADLPEHLRLVTVLAAIQEQGIKDVAALLGIPEGTVKSRLFEARKQLRERLR